MLDKLLEHMKETLDIADGFTTGTLIVEDSRVSLELPIGEHVMLDDSFLIEVRNIDKYEPITVKQALKTIDKYSGGSVFAGLYARVRLKEVGIV